MFHLWFCLILLDVKINLYQCQCQCQYWAYKVITYGLSITRIAYLRIISHYKNYIIRDYIAEVSRNTFYSNEICDKLKTTQTSKKYSFPSYFCLIETNTISIVHSCIAKKYSYASHAFVFSIFFLKKNTYCCRTRRLYVCPSVCVNVFLRNVISNKPIEILSLHNLRISACPKGGIFPNSNCKLQINAICIFLQTNLCARF